MLPLGLADVITYILLCYVMFHCSFMSANKFEFEFEEQPHWNRLGDILLINPYLDSLKSEPVSLIQYPLSFINILRFGYGARGRSLPIFVAL